MKPFWFNLTRKVLKWAMGTDRIEVSLRPAEKVQGSVKILGISGSPRGRKSRSYKMMAKVLEHARVFGAQTQEIILCEKTMKPCEGCLSDPDKECTFPCIHCEDDTNEILQMMIDADAFVFATPIHWAAPSAIMKILIDKMISLEENHYEIAMSDGREPLLGKPCALIASQEGDGATGALGWMAAELREMGVWTIPCGQTFKPALLEKKIVKLGMFALGERKFEWIENNLAAAGRNLALVTRLLKESGYKWDDYDVIEPNC